MDLLKYVDENVVKTGQVSKAAVLGLDGNTCATSSDMNISPQEGQAMTAIFDSPQLAFTKGVTAAGTKYLASKADERSIYCKRGGTGLIVCKINTAMIAAIYDQGQQGVAAPAVEKVADYLRESGN